MFDWPEFNSEGDLPSGVYRASLTDVIDHFGTATPQRRIVSRRLARIFELASSTRHLSRFIVFGSFVTSKLAPNDVDIFLLMEDSFEVGQLTGAATVVFRQSTAQKIGWAPASFGYGGSLQSEESSRQSKIGSSSATARDEESWR